MYGVGSIEYEFEVFGSFQLLLLKFERDFKFMI